MLKGKKVFFSSLIFMGLSSFLVAANPAGAQAVSSGPVAGADNIAPGPVGEVSVEADLGAVSVDVSWSESDDDYSRSVAASADFTSGGVFVGTNDVAGYEVWRSVVVGDPEQIAVVGSGETAYR